MDSSSTRIMITEEETDILQEIMNIAFGRAASDLAEYIDIFVILSVPYIKLLRIAELPPYIQNEIAAYEKISLVEQNFWGKFKGSAFLVFPSDSGKKILSMMLDSSDDCFESDPINDLEKETFREVGNILIGACIGKIAELLGDVTTYSPPRVVVERSHRNIISENLFNEDDLAIVLTTVFEFNEQNISGYLFIITTQESFDWLKTALHKFVEQYEC